ncbi:MAG: TetR/AcrR family transcriptional regulator [Henriciella sp.]|nr:TetR/AcrR family transcriptional regulator [Henriciella sp.]
MNDLVEPSSDEAPLSRREQQKEEKNKALIDAALAVFSRVGFAAAKMDDVAREAGVSKGTVYLYFDSKEQLFEEMVKANMAPLMTEIAENLARPSISATERLKAHMKFFYTKILNTNRRQIMRLIMAEGPNFPHLAEFYHSNVLSRGQAVIKAIIQQGIDSGEFRDLQGHGLVQNIVAGALVAGIWKLVFDPFQPLDLDAYFDTHVDLILNGLKA